MRQRLLLVLPPLLLLSACSGSFGATYDRLVGNSATWSVSGAYPDTASLGDCHEDPSVETAALSYDMPSSGYGMILVDGATETDALRIADCLAEARISDAITIVAPGF